MRFPSPHSDDVARACLNTVIASEAKQSRNPSAEAAWIASSQGLLAMTSSEPCPRPHSVTGTTSIPAASPGGTGIGTVT
ncbi:hypothetical protein ABIA06_004426 [Bradyrhizobium yuanmingense]